MAFTRIDRADYNGKGVIGLPDAPQLSTNAMQEKFEEISLDVIIPKHNTLIDELESATGASNIGTRNGNVQSEIDAFDGKIATFNGDISQLKSDMTQAQGDIATLQSGVNTNKTDIAALQSDNTTNKADIATNKANITTLQNENTTNKANITKNANDISALQTSVTTNANNIASLQSDNTTNKADIASLKSDNVTLKGKAHVHANKGVIDALSKDSATGNLMFEGNPISGGGSGNTDSYGHVKVGSVTIDASGDDTIELVAGSNVTLTPNATNKSVTISASGGGGGTSTGDMLKSEFVLPGGTGQVLSAKEADHATNADNATSANSASTATIADKAMAMFDGTNEIPTNQFMQKSVYDADDDGVVDNAKHATNADNVGNADTSLLEKLSDSPGKLNYNGNALMLEAAQLANQAKVGEFVVNQKSNNVKELALHPDITTKLSKVDKKIDKPTSATDGQVLTYNGTTNEWEAQNSQGGGQFVIIAKGKSYEGQTVTATKGTKSKSAVITSGVARIPVDEGGVWTLTLSSGETWNTPNMTYYGEYEVALVPNGSTVTPTDDIQTWLKCADLNKSYTTISQVLADTNTLSALISDNNASDYMVRSTTWASDVCSNESAMTYIGLNDYCANKLLADSTWLTAICSTEETLLKKVLNVYVPTLSSNTSDDGGEVSASNSTESIGYETFDGNDSTYWASSKYFGWLNYKFKNLVCVKAFYLMPFNYDKINQDMYYNCRVKDFNITASKTGNDNDWHELFSGQYEIGNLNKIQLNNNEYYRYYKINILNTYDVDSSVVCAVTTLQYYGREEA